MPEGGPSTVRTLGFTENPVQFLIGHAKVMMRRTAEDESPKIYLRDVRGEMLKPNPLPRPVRVAHASGLVRMVGKPMVGLTVRTCIGANELRAHAVVPAPKRPGPAHA